MLEEQQLQQSPLNQRVERDVRTLIGDLQMQIVILRAMLDEANQKLQGFQPFQQATNGLDRTEMASVHRQPPAT